MSIFKNTHIELGDVKISSTHKLIFEYDSNLVTRFTQIKSPCDCASAGVEYNLSAIVVNYKVKPVPLHLANNGATSYPVRKTITVTYILPNGTGMSEALIFTCTAKQ